MAKGAYFHALSVISVHKVHWKK